MNTMSRRTFGKAVAATAATTALVDGVATGSAPQALAADVAGADYLIGTGIYDITGAVAETGAFGYAANQEMNGLQERLYAHAFIFGSLDGATRTVFVSADLGAMFQSVKLGVTAKLVAKYGNLYRDDNVMLSATHTHAGNSGQSHDRLYQIAGNDAAGYGYDKYNFAAVVDGIVAAIGRAHANLAPGNITLQTGTLAGATRNRSLVAYQASSDASAFDSPVNQTMLQLKLTAADGTPRGLVNWFSIHPTSFSNKTTHISADNKGYAQYFFEQHMGTHPTDDNGFVVAFAQSDEGDVVSSQGNANSAAGFQGSSDEFLNAEIDGQRQLAKALQLFDSAGTPLTGPLDMRSRWVNFGDYTVSAKYAGGTAAKLCTPGRGWSFACGAENGPSNIPGIYEGMTRGSFSIADKSAGLGQAAAGSLVRFAFASASTLTFADDPAQGAKPVLLPDGKWGWAPLQMQVQIMRLGSLAIIAVPGEATTMCGRRIRKEVLDVLAGSGVTTAVIAGLSNQYMGYITTPEEYDTQQYEGASTEFGRNQLGALLQEFNALATGLAKGTATPGITPTDSPYTGGTRPGVVLDDKPLGQKFGDVLTQPAASYTAGQTASAVFRGGHPKNNFRTMGTFLKVQKLEGGTWTDVLDDHDWDTSYTWVREGASYSRCTVEWRIRKGTAAGTYRLVQQGDWKNGWNGAVSAYTGTSRSFTVA